MMADKEKSDQPVEDIKLPEKTICDLKNFFVEVVRITGISFTEIMLSAFIHMLFKIIAFILHFTLEELNGPFANLFIIGTMKLNHRG